jgi:hypothetical protein
MALSRLLLCASILWVSVACIADPYRPTQGRYSAHVAWLADDAREGREAGTQGYEDAADYAAAELESYGLEPLGDAGGWFQAFEASGNRKLVSGNRLAVGSQELELETEWVPFASAPTGEVSGPVTFVGYGMVDEGDDDGAGAWDDYAGVDVEGRVVVVLRRGPLAPGAEPATGRWFEGRGQKHITTFAKINAAYKAGAAGIVIVNDPRGYDELELHEDAPIPYRTSFRGATASLPAVSMSLAAAQRVFTPHGLDLAAEQQALDAEQGPRSRALDGARLSLTVSAERETVTTWNVIARLPGRDTDDGDEHVLVGAHLDHLGLGLHGGSMGGSETAGQVHNGADDNASGSAGVLELARAFAEQPRRPGRDVIFVLFGAEEWGLLGSRHYVAHPAVSLDDCVAMINMDMIGRSEQGRVEVGGVGTAAVLPDLLEEALDDLDSLHAETTPSVNPNSDHQPFLEAGIPVVSLFTGLHGEYHRPTDDVHTLDMAGGADIAALGGLLARRLADLDERPAFIDPDAGGGAHAAPTEGRSGRGYSVSFGSLPDMTDTSDQGMRVRATMSGSPAEKCGLLKGDVIVALDGTPIRNLQDYAVLLFSHEPGDEITLTVVRDGETLELTAILAAPRGET